MTNRPNVLWITTDRQRFDTLGCMGNPHVRTPHLRTDRYALSVAHNLNTGELYDLHADPGGVRNLWDSPGHAQIKTELLVRLTNRMADTIDPLPPTEGPF